MKEKFKQIEAVLQNFIEANMAKLFGEEQAENELASRLVAAMQDNIHSGEGGIVHAPNLFTITVHPDYAQDLSSNQGLLEKLAEVIQQAGEEEGFRFAIEPGISLLPDPEMVAGEYAVHAYRTEDELTETQALETIDTDDGDIPPQAFLIVGGSQIFSLENDVVNLGRKLDNNLVLEDPRVSHPVDQGARRPRCRGRAGRQQAARGHARAGSKTRRGRRAQRYRGQHAGRSHRGGSQPGRADDRVDRGDRLQHVGLLFPGAGAQAGQAHQRPHGGQPGVWQLQPSASKRAGRRAGRCVQQPRRAAI